MRVKQSLTSIKTRIQQLISGSQRKNSIEHDRNGHIENGLLLLKLRFCGKC